MGGKGSGVNATGRKRKSSEGRVSFSVSCTKDEREIIKKIAEDKKLTISQLVICSVGENARLKKHIEDFNLCGNTVSKISYNEVLNENIFLKKRNQNLKCCGNCIHCYEEKHAGLCCNLFDGEKYVPSIEKRNCDKWEPDKN